MHLVFLDPVSPYPKILQRNRALLFANISKKKARTFLTSLGGRILQCLELLFRLFLPRPGDAGRWQIWHAALALFSEIVVSAAKSPKNQQNEVTQPDLNLRYYSASLCRRAGISFVEFQAASPTAKQDPHFQQVL